MTRILEVALGERSYPIHIGAGLLDNSELFEHHVRSDQVMIITDDTVAPLYLDRVKSTLTPLNPRTLVLPDGEENKNLTVWNRIFDALLDERFNRACTLLALGGGVIGDVVGFAAACYQRGVDFIQIPTTLLAQVDSSVGGKTGVNHAKGKNMIGAFYQPQCVIADTETLNTLDDRQLRAGIAEVIKYGLIRDLEFFEWLEKNLGNLLDRQDEALAYAIERSCRNKAEVVAADEWEAGQRALLNLGHTFGHAIETGVGYGEWLHGEAVAAGMCMAADLSRRLGWLSVDHEERIIELIRRAGLPVAPPPELAVDQWLDLMAVDKKVLQGRLRLVLLKGLGASLVTADFDYQQLHSTLREYNGEVR